MSGTVTWPPDGPTVLTAAIPAYVYQQYSDDQDIQAFNQAYNDLAQRYVTTLATLNLPVYTSDTIAGALLDWVGEGVYGLPRPTLPSGGTRDIGAYNTWSYNGFVFNSHKIVGPQAFYATSDDIYKRIITWHFFKGDGKVFNIRWLKRRVMRFLLGGNGTAPHIDATPQVSISFGIGNQVNINLISGVRTVTGGAIFNRFGFNATTYNGLQSKFTQLAPLADAEIFQAAVAAGVLELPFQFQWVVTIEGVVNVGQTGLVNDGGVLVLAAPLGYPTSTSGLPCGALWSNGGVVSVVSGTIPNPAAPAVYFGAVTAAALLSLGGGNLPTSAPSAGSGQLWNSGGEIWVA